MQQVLCLSRPPHWRDGPPEAPACCGSPQRGDPATKFVHHPYDCHALVDAGYNDPFDMNMKVNEASFQSATV